MQVCRKAARIICMFVQVSGNKIAGAWEEGFYDIMTRKAATGRPVDRKLMAEELTEVLDSRFFTALAEPARVELLKLLIQNGRSDVAALTACVPQDVSVISRHLRLLHEAGIVRREKVQRHVFYEIDQDGCKRRFRALYERMENIINACCPGP